MAKIKSKKTIEKEMDGIWAKKVFERDGHKCQVCMKILEGRNKHPHHVLPRQLKGLRWDVNNGITLCYYHHKIGIYSPHQNAIWFFGWMNENKPQQLKYCIEKLKSIKQEI